MYTLSHRGVSRRAFPAAAMAALTVACSDNESPTNPSRATTAASAAAIGAGNGSPGGRGAGIGQIVFASNRDPGGNFEIYVAADTANAVAVRLTDSRATEWQPTWSPDYKKIAFMSDRDGNLEIYSMNANGSGITRLTNNPEPDAQPVYSPDGTKIAFTSYRDGNPEIYVMNADGTNAKRLTVDGGSDTEPTWSPDGSKIAFTSDRLKKNSPQIWIMNADGSGPTRFSPANTVERGAHWSPDGARIVLRSLRTNVNDIMWREVTAMRTAGASHVIVSSANTFGRPTWSPDGSRVVFEAYMSGEQTYFAMDAFKAGGILFKGVTNNYLNISPAWSR